MKFNLKALLLIFIFNSTFFKMSAQNKTSQLNYPANAASAMAFQKYSYLLYGETAESRLTVGSGFFIKKDNKTYLVTAFHVLTGWDTFNFKSELNPAIKYYIRVRSNKNAVFSFVPISIIDYINKPYNFYHYEKPDICFYEVNLPAEFPVFSMEDIIENYDDNIQSAAFFSWGFPPTSPNSAEEIIQLVPQYGSGIVLSDYTENAEYKSNNHVDKLNYIGQFVITEYLGPGSSGAPVFLKTFDEKVRFGGMIYGGGQTGEYTYNLFVVKPSIIKNMLNNIVPLNRPLK